MTRRARAMVVGKFYPPHRGHSALIAAALEEALEVTVVVMASGAESVPLEERMAWLRDTWAGFGVKVVGVCCDAPLDLEDDLVWEAQVAAIRAAMRTGGSGPADVVVSGETYGDRLARYFDAEHVLVARSYDGLCASRIRADLVGNWDQLEPATRAGLAVRVVVLGAESTGTTTVSKSLGDHYRSFGGVWARTECVDEHGRAYTEELWTNQRNHALAHGREAPALTELVWDRPDFDAIAGKQTSIENEAAARGSPLLICDTDALATAVWERRYLNENARSDADWARPPKLSRHDLYLLTSHDRVPWIDDGIREGDLAVREAMTDWFADALTTRQLPWALLTGSPEQRLQLAIRSIEPVLERRLRLTDPLTGPGFPTARGQ